MNVSSMAEALLIELVDAQRDLPRGPWWVTRIQGGTLVTRPDRKVNLQPYWGDILELAEAGMIRLELTSKNGGSFDIRPAGFDRYMVAKEASGIGQVETELMTYLDDDGFKDRHPMAHAKWSEASRSLWAEDADDHPTTIGHLSREALQAFATELVERYDPGGVTTVVNKDYARVKAVIDAEKGRLGERVTATLDALLHYWGTVTDLVQRQEHASDLGREDSRRVVFMTAVVMHEVDLALTRSAEPR